VLMKRVGFRRDRIRPADSTGLESLFSRHLPTVDVHSVAAIGLYCFAPPRPVRIPALPSWRVEKGHPQILRATLATACRNQESANCASRCTLRCQKVVRGPESIASASTVPILQARPAEFPVFIKAPPQRYQRCFAEICSADPRQFGNRSCPGIFCTRA
jgi:hypothetical protein